MLSTLSLTRRRLLSLIGFAGAGVAGSTALSGCVSGAGGGDAGGTVTPGQEIARADAVPVGGAMPFKEPGTGRPAVLFRPDEATFVAHRAICTHAGCTVAFQPGSKKLDCPCHGSEFDPRTGEVLRGPAGQPLRAVAVRRVGDVIETA